MQLIATILIIVVTITTIILALVLVSRITLRSLTNRSFTYGSTVKIQSVATNGFLAPSCEFSTTFQGSRLANPDATVIASAVTASTIRTEEKNIFAWKILTPPLDAPSGYVFQNVAGGQYMVVKQNGTNSAPLLAIKNARSPQLTPAFLYNDPSFVLQIIQPRTLTTTSGNDDIYIITHTEGPNSYQLVTMGAINSANQLIPLPTRCSEPASLKLGGIPNQLIASTESTACTGINTVCVQFVLTADAENNFPLIQRTYRITTTTT
jgi:hypothetical protein